jgi:NAD-dependent dihydropyrimidine dehydrogenase PreA subunit
MAYVISADKCVSCGVCESECPVSAISQGDASYVISEECISCGACAGVCPNEAISEG